MLRGHLAEPEPERGEERRAEERLHVKSVCLPFWLGASASSSFHEGACTVHWVQRATRHCLLLPACLPACLPTALLEGKERIVGLRAAKELAAKEGNGVLRSG